MDEAEDELVKVAMELVTASRSQLLNTIVEIAELEEHLRQLKARRDGQVHAQSRLNSYQPRVGGKGYICPNCWIVDGNPTLLKPIPFGRHEEDVLRCPACGRDFGISLRRMR